MEGSWVGGGGSMVGDGWFGWLSVGYRRSHMVQPVQADQSCGELYIGFGDCPAIFVTTLE